MAEKATSIVQVQLSEFAVVRAPSDALAIIKDALAMGEKLSLSSFDRLKVPTGAAQVFDVPWGEPAKSLDVIILLRQPVRSYYSEAYKGGNSPPDCHSIDMVHGVGAPGGECVKCPLNTWGSKVRADGSESRGKACSERALMFFLTPDSLLPGVISIPPSSYKVAQDYQLRCGGRGHRLWHMVTRLALEKVEGGIPYSRLTLATGSVLDEATKAAVEAYRTEIEPHLKALIASAGDWTE